MPEPETKSITIDPSKLQPKAGGFSATAAHVSLVDSFVELIFSKCLPGSAGCLAAICVRIPAERVAGILSSSSFQDKLESYVETRSTSVPDLKPPDYAALAPKLVAFEYASFFQLAHAENEAEFLFFKISPFSIHNKQMEQPILVIRAYVTSGLMLATLRQLNILLQKEE